MLLAERAGVWNAKPTNRHLPSLWEDVKIRLLTDHKRWTSPQQQNDETGRHAFTAFALAPSRD